MESNIFSQVKSINTLAAALEWACQQPLPAKLTDVIAQDEYTIDVVFRLTSDTFIVFDTT
ncbi:MAG: hypothetical protein AB1489_16575 [Acidobacteriota bacterium]